MSIWGRAADLLDPPLWAPENRPPLLPHQQPPSGRPDLWLLEGGRGIGKTEGSARYFASYMRANPGHRGRIIAPTLGDAVAACIRGPSGLLTIDPEIRFLPSSPGGAMVVWPNGSEALVIGTPTPRDVERLRAGGNRHIDWWEEMAANPQLEAAWTQAQLGLRLGDRPHSIASSTPRATKAFKNIRKGRTPESTPDEPRSFGTVALTHATIDDNPHSNPEWRAKMKAAYAGTRMGRQELAGELIDDVAGALTKRAWWELAQRGAVDPLQVHKKVLGLDTGEPGPQQSQAMVMMQRTADQELWVSRAERSGDGPSDFLRHAVRIAHAEGAILAVETNWTGAAGAELLERVMRELGMRVPYAPVKVHVGKRARAEPFAILVEQGKVHTLPGTGNLVDEFCGWDATGDSPHLIDACTAAFQILQGGGFSDATDTVAQWTDGGAGVVSWDDG